MIPAGTGYPEPGGVTFTAGHSGTDTSRDRALDETASGTSKHRQETTLELLREGGLHGITVIELRRITGWHHGQASAALSNLHKAGQVVRLAEVRDRCKVYVLPGFACAKPTEEFASRVKKPKRSDDLNTDTLDVLNWVSGIPLATIGDQTSIVTSMPNRIIEAARRSTEGKPSRSDGLNPERAVEIMAAHNVWAGVSGSPGYWAWEAAHRDEGQWYALCASDRRVGEVGCGWTSEPHTFETREEARRAAYAHVVEMLRQS